MIILGIDPGSRKTGFGVIKTHKNKCYYVASGFIKSVDGDIPHRLKEIAEGINDVIKAYHPDDAAIEQIFMCKSAVSALKLGQARGVAMCTLAQNYLDISDYSAKQVKQAIVGTGAATKDQVQHMVTTFLNLEATPQEDAADALAVAICHFHTRHSLLHIAGASKITRRRLR